MEISNRLSRLANFYRREGLRCASGRAYLAGAAMQIAALEALLQAMCFLYPSQIRWTQGYSRMRFRRRRNKALDFTLYQLIGMADELGWFPQKRVTWGGRRTTLAGFAHEVRNLRNYVHPGKWATEHPLTTTFTKTMYAGICEVTEVASSWLVHRVHESLRRAIARRLI